MEDKIAEWLSAYGYGAAFPAVLSDPAGIPWAWIFLMLLAQKAGKNIAVLLLIGFCSLWGCDLLLYFIGSRYGTRLLAWMQKRRPAWKETLDKAEANIQKRGALTVIVGRYLPLVGRWVGLGAGMARVPVTAFAFYSAIGAALSAFGFGIPSYFLGRQIIDNPVYMQIALGVCIVGMGAGILTCIWTAWKSKTRKMPA